MSFLKSPAARHLGFALTRAVIPAWVFAGAAFKLWERTAINLPSGMVATAKDVGLDLEVLLRTLIGLEFLAAAVMLFLARFARPMAIFMTASFCAILLWELKRSATSCGCFGAVEIHPGVMLAIDGALLLGAILFRPARVERMPKWSLAAAALAIAAGFGASFATPPKKREPPPPPPDGVPTTDNGDTTPPPPPPPSFWWAKDLDTWLGRSYDELNDLFRIIPPPAGVDEGRKILVFYRRDCDHCYEMFLDYFEEGLDAPVIAYRIPSPADWELPPTTGVRLIDLPYDEGFWVIETPLVISLTDGVVTCVVEGLGFERCLE